MSAQETHAARTLRVGDRVWYRPQGTAMQGALFAGTVEGLPAAHSESPVSDALVWVRVHGVVIAESDDLATGRSAGWVLAEQVERVPESGLASWSRTGEQRLCLPTNAALGFLRSGRALSPAPAKPESMGPAGRPEVVVAAVAAPVRLARPAPTRTVQGGLLVAIEGIDGAGKTTQAAWLAHRMRALGHEVLLEKEPTDGPIGRTIRAAALNGVRMPKQEEYDAFLNDRREHVDAAIHPALARGAVVILDRYFWSMAAYQSQRGFTVAQIMRDNESFAPRPHIGVVLAVNADVAMARIAARGGPANAFERRDELLRAASVFSGIVLSRKEGVLLNSNGLEWPLHEMLFAEVQTYLRVHFPE